MCHVGRSVNCNAGCGGNDLNCRHEVDDCVIGAERLEHNLDLHRDAALALHATSHVRTQPSCARTTAACRSSICSAAAHHSSGTWPGLAL